MKYSCNACGRYVEYGHDCYQPSSSLPEAMTPPIDTKGAVEAVPVARGSSDDIQLVIATLRDRDHRILGPALRNLMAEHVESAAERLATAEREISRLEINSAMYAASAETAERERDLLTAELALREVSKAVAANELKAAERERDEAQRVANDLRSEHSRLNANLRAMLGPDDPIAAITRETLRAESAERERDEARSELADITKRYEHLHSVGGGYAACNAELEREVTALREDLQHEQDAWAVASARAEVAEDLHQCAERELSKARSELAEVRKDKARLDWLERQYVEVRKPLLYGSRAMFIVSPGFDEDGDEPNKIRTAIDAHAAALSAMREEK